MIQGKAIAQALLILAITINCELNFKFAACEDGFMILDQNTNTAQCDGYGSDWNECSELNGRTDVVEIYDGAETTWEAWRGGYRDFYMMAAQFQDNSVMSYGEGSNSDMEDCYPSNGIKSVKTGGYDTCILDNDNNLCCGGDSYTTGNYTDVRDFWLQGWSQQMCQQQINGTFHCVGDYEDSTEDEKITNLTSTVEYCSGGEDGFVCLTESGVGHSTQDGAQVAVQGGLYYSDSTCNVTINETCLDSDIAKLACNWYACYAITTTGELFTWGYYDNREQGDAEQFLRSDVSECVLNDEAGAAILSDGSLYAWGDTDYGGNASLVEHAGDLQMAAALLGLPFELKCRPCSLIAGVDQLGCILTNGAPLTWGEDGNSTHIHDHMSEIQLGGEELVTLLPSRGAWAALSTHGKVIAWGDELYGGNVSGIVGLESGVRQIINSKQGFGAVLCNGSIITWGNSGNGDHFNISTEYVTGGDGAGCTVNLVLSSDKCSYSEYVPPVIPNVTDTVVEEEEGLPVWAIVVIAVGAALVVGVSIIVIFKCVCKPKVNKVGE